MRAFFILLGLGVTLLGAACERSALPIDDGKGGAGGLGGSGGFGGSDKCSQSGSYQLAECNSELTAICHSKSDADCEKTEGCQLLDARPIDSVRACIEAESEVVGCGAIGCGALYVVGADADGKEWLFPSTCLPAGFTANYQAGYSLSDECAGLGGAGGAGGAR